MNDQLADGAEADINRDTRKFSEDQLDLPPGSNKVRSHVSERGTLVLFRNSGPPTWWFPKARIKRWESEGRRYYELGGGWIRVCYQLIWAPNPRVEE